MLRPLYVFLIEGVDTTDARYQLGHKIGEFIPVALLIIVAVIIIRKSYKH